jgi:hypothetical protein
MKTKEKILCTLILFVFAVNVLQSQVTLSATGGEATGSGGFMSYSVGQLFYHTHGSANGTVAEGVQQPYEISVVTGDGEVTGIGLAVSAFPNPAKDYLILRAENDNFANLEYHFYDVSGSLIMQKTITANETAIYLVSIEPGVYFLKVSQITPDHKELKTFKIIKK